MRIRLALTLLAAQFLCCVLPAMSQQPAVKAEDFRSFPPELRAQCVQSLQTPLPKEVGTAPIRPGFGDVYAMDLYYGLGDRARDYVAARHQAWGERAGNLGVNGSSLLLAMIYTNGLGTPRNPGLAMRMACEETVTYRNDIGVQDLERLSKTLANREQPPGQYHICDPQRESPTAAKGFCAWVASARVDQQWSNRLKELSVGWTPEQRQKLDALKRVSRFYLTGISSAENPVTKLEDTELQQIETMEAGHLPSTTQIGAAEAEAKLNAVFRKLTDQLRAPSENLHGLHSVRMELSEQIEWLAFREAWMGLIAARFSNLDANRWRAQLTVERVARLQQKSEALPPVDPKATGWLATCARYRDTPLPAEISAIKPINLTEETPKLKLCSSAASYYGLGTSVDYAEARHCAALERLEVVDPWAGNSGDKSNPLDVLNIYGPEMLTMIYANGNGVARNTALAMRFACESIDAGELDLEDAFSPEDSEGDGITPSDFLAEVATMGEAAGGKRQRTIDMCSYAGNMDWDISDCDYIRHLLDEQQRMATIESLSRNFNPEQKAAYLKLISAFEAYLKAHNDNETSVTGHHPADPQWERQPQQEIDFIENMRRFESGKLPFSNSADYARADRALNDLYRQTMVNARNLGQSDVGWPPKPEGLRDTERLWLVYRDAWAAFGVLRYPQVSKENWLTWATLQRIDDLKTFGELVY